MRINEDYLEIDGFDKDDMLSKDVEVAQEKKPEDFYFCVALDFCNFKQKEKPLLSKKLERAFDTMPCIKDYLLVYGHNTDSEYFTEDENEVSVYMDKDFRKPSEVYKMMVVLEKIFNTSHNEDIRYTFYLNGAGCTNSTFLSMVRQRDKKRGISDGYFYDFFNMCQMAMNMKCDPQKCADFIGFDFGLFIIHEMMINSSDNFDLVNINKTISLSKLFEYLPQKLSNQTCRYYLPYIELSEYNNIIQGIAAHEVINFVKAHFKDELYIENMWVTLTNNNISQYSIYLGALTGENNMAVGYMLRVCFPYSEKDLEQHFVRALKIDIVDDFAPNKLNEDYIEKIDARDEIDITQDDIETSIQNLINGTYDKLSDVDLSLLPDAFYKPSDNVAFITLLKACLDNIGKFLTPNLNWINTSDITEMNNLMSYRNIFADISRWNVSNVTSMMYLFENSSVNCDISNWNVSNVRDMHSMFAKADIHTNISKWDVHNVEDMNRMFMYTKFDEDFDISGWDVSIVKNMNAMFNGSNFAGDISKWNVSEVTDMGAMFGGTHYFNCDISEWNMMKVTDCSNMFYSSSYACDLSGLKINPKAKTSYMFSSCPYMKKEMLPLVILNKKKKKKVNEDYIEKVSDRDELVRRDDIINDEILIAVQKVKDGTYDSKWDVDLQKLTAVYKPAGKIELKTLIYNFVLAAGSDCSLNWLDVSEMTDLSNLFISVSRYSANSGAFNGDVSKWDTSSVVNMAGMFQYSSFNGDISKWNVSNVRNMEEMFDGSKFNNDISEWDVHNVESFAAMFYNSEFLGDVKDWNVSKCENFNYMFTNSDFHGDLSKWEISEDATTEEMLIGCHVKYENYPDRLKVTPDVEL